MISVIQNRGKHINDYAGFLDNLEKEGSIVQSDIEDVCKEYNVPFPIGDDWNKNHADERIIIIKYRAITKPSENYYEILSVFEFPIAKNIHASLVASEVVSVAPLAYPSNNIYVT